MPNTRASLPSACCRGVMRSCSLSQIFYGVLRYMPFLSILVEALLVKHTGGTAKADSTLYKIVSYLTIFRSDELGPRELANIIRPQHPPAMHCLLQFLFNAEELNDWVKREWARIYDLKYIEDDIIGGLQRRKPRFIPLLEELAERATQVEQAEAEAQGEEEAQGGLPRPPPIPPTEPVPFNLSKPKPRLLPAPFPVSREVKANPVNEKVLKRTSLQKIMRKAKTRRVEVGKKTLQKYLRQPPEGQMAGEGEAEKPALCNPPRLQTMQRPSDKERIREEVERERNAELTFARETQHTQRKRGRGRNKQET